MPKIPCIWTKLDEFEPQGIENKAMNMLDLPTRRDESWRYSDLSALQSVWPLVASGCAWVTLVTISNV